MFELFLIALLFLILVVLSKIFCAIDDYIHRSK
jgi:hypothetical protein